MNIGERVRRYAALLLSLLVLLTPLTGWAETAVGVLNPSDLAGFVDGIYQQAIDAYHIPGSIFIAVQDGQVVLSKGYGYADLEHQLPVDPGQTAFRIGSISKLFVAIAAMQQVQAGNVDLHADVNDCLRSLQVPDAFAEPVTLHHLLTHTAGFDERLTGMSAPSYTEVKPLSEYLAANLPARVRAPGQITQYSNHGFALAGLLVSDLSGEEYGSYVREHILAPLGMDQSFPRLSAEALPSVAGEYVFRGQQEKLPPYEFNVYPAGAMAATGVDMAKFINAVLFRDERLLSAEAWDTLLTTQFSPAEGMAGMAYGFIERLHGGARLLLHGGSTLGTQSFLLLDPASGFGFFTASSGPGGAALNEKLVEGFLDRYYPDQLSSPAPGEVNTALAGHYRSVRHARTTLDKLLVLMGRDSSVKVLADGTLEVWHHGATAIYDPLDATTFQNRDDGSLISFRIDSGGRARYLFDGRVIQAYERIPVWENNGLHKVLLALAICSFLAALFSFAPRLARSIKALTTTERYAWYLARTTGVLGLVALGTFALGAVLFDLTYRLPLLCLIGLICFMLMAVGTVALLGLTGLSWLKVRRVTSSTLLLSLASLLAVGFVLVASYYNLIGLKY